MSRDGSRRRFNGSNFVGSVINKGATAEGLLTCTSTFPAVHRIVDGLRGDFRPIPNNDAYARYLVYAHARSKQILLWPIAKEAPCSVRVLPL